MNISRLTLWVCISLLAGWAGMGTGWAATRNPAHYIGVRTCGICHKREKTGNQFSKWQASPHSKAFEVLGTPDAKAIAAKLGITDPQASGKCLKCHSTAYNWTEQVQTEKIKIEDGVVCESCHGPGESYLSQTVMEITLSADPLDFFAPQARTCMSQFTMEERGKAVTAGLIYPATKSCALCHNDQGPAWKPDRYTTQDGRKVGFDLEQNTVRIAHGQPQAAK